MHIGTDVHVTLCVSTLWVQNAMLRGKAMTPFTHSIFSVFQIEWQWAYCATVVHLLLWVLSQLPVFHMYCYDFPFAAHICHNCLFLACIFSQFPICCLCIVVIANLLPKNCHDCLFVACILSLLLYLLLLLPYYTSNATGEVMILPFYPY